MAFRLFRIDMVGGFTPSCSALIDAAIPDPKEFSANLQITANTVLERKSLVSINFAELNLSTNMTYTVTLPQGFFLDGFDEMSPSQTISFSTPATVPLISSFTPASNAANHNTYGDHYIYIDYGRAVNLQNKNYYLYSNFNNPSGYIVSTINALSNRVTKITDSKIRINLDSFINPSRTYWIRAEEGIVTDSFYFKSAEITNSVYDFTTVSESFVSLSNSSLLQAAAYEFTKGSAALVSNSTVVCNPMKVKVASASISSTSSMNIESIRLFRLIHTTNTSVSGTHTANATRTFGNHTLILVDSDKLFLYDNTTGQKIRTTTFTPPSGLNATMSIALNSSYYAVGVPKLNTYETSEVYVYSIATGNLSYTLSGDLPQLGMSMAMNDSYLAIAGTGEYNGVQAGILICNPATGGLQRKITRPSTPWRQANNNIGTWTYFGGELAMNNNGYLAVAEPNDATSSSSFYTGNFRIYNMATGSMSAKINGSVSGGYYTSFQDVCINNSIAIGSDMVSTKQYAVPGGSIVKTVLEPEGEVYGLNNKWALINTNNSRQLLELSSDVYQTTDIGNSRNNTGVSEDYVSYAYSSIETVGGVTTTIVTVKIYRF